MDDRQLETFVTTYCLQLHWHAVQCAFLITLPLYLFGISCVLSKLPFYKIIDALPRLTHSLRQDVPLGKSSSIIF